MADNILPFLRPHRGDPELRRMALASIGFQWREGQWRRGRDLLTDQVSGPLGAQRTRPAPPPRVCSATPPRT
jgi:hypothetical protein